jgi:type II secretory pathway pseudopilin PulG
MFGHLVDRERGFSLLEVVCATAIFITGLAALAQLLTIAIRLNNSARTTTVAAVIAVQKMEQLRGLAWGFDDLRPAFSDVVTEATAVPQGSAASADLSPSPTDSLLRNTGGYCDFVDRNGQSIGGGASPPPGTAYIRRWSIEPLPADAGNTLVLRVRVTARRDRGVDDTAGIRRLPDEAWLTTVKTRKAK